MTDFLGLEEDPYTIVVDDTVSFDIYLPGSTADFFTSPPPIRNGMIYKFSPDWELLWHKRLVVESEGNATEYDYEGEGDSINKLLTPYLTGLSYDEDDNMYLVGYMQPGYYGQYAWVNHYPIYFYWDSTHYATMLDNSSSECMPFIIKYNTDGEVQWCNQLYSRTTNDSVGAYTVQSYIYMGCVDTKFCYIVGQGFNITPSEDRWIAFDREGRIELSRSQPSQDHSAFFACYNRETGEYVTHGIVPAEKKSIISSKKACPAVINNQIYCLSTCVPYQVNTGVLLNRWAIDGTYLDSDTISATYPNVSREHGKTTIDNNGHILVAFGGKSPYSFPDGITLDCSSAQSNAIFALKYDPRTMEPYPVPNNLEVTENARPENTLTIYPNPASDVLTLKLSGNERITKSEVYDLGGNLISKHRGNTVNVQGLPAGLYIVNISAGKKNYSAKFEKM